MQLAKKYNVYEWLKCSVQFSWARRKFDVGTLSQPQTVATAPHHA